ncbi:MAG: hypothetical protein U0264_19330 [Candidatus Kapaibacterium sp.]
MNDIPLSPAAAEQWKLCVKYRKTTGAVLRLHAPFCERVLLFCDSFTSAR